MRTLEQQLELGRKVYNVATVHTLVAELKEQHGIIIAEKNKRINELEGVIRGGKAIVESMEEQIKTQKLTILQLQDDLARMAEAMNAEY